MNVKKYVLEVRCVKRVSKSQPEIVFTTEIARQRRNAVAIGKAQCEARPRKNKFLSSLLNVSIDVGPWVPWG